MHKETVKTRLRVLFLFLSRPQSEDWPHHGLTFSIYPCPLSFWLTLPRTVLSTSWCCPSRPCVAFLACVHLALFLALSFLQATPLFPHGVTIVCYSFLALTVSSSSFFASALLRTHSFVFFAVHETRRIFLTSKSFHLKGVKKGHNLVGPLS